MCNTCNDPCYTWDKGCCSDCGNSVNDNFDQLYANYYSKLSTLIGGKFWPGQGIPTAQLPPIDTTQYLNYIDVVTGFFYQWNYGTSQWTYLFNLSGAIESVINQWLIPGANVSIVPTINGLQVSANIAAVPSTETLETITGRGAFTDHDITIAGRLQVNAETATSIISTSLSVTGSAQINNEIVTNSAITNATFVNGVVSYMKWLTGPPTTATAASNYSLIGFDNVTNQWEAVPRQQVLSGPAGSLPPTTGNFLPGDLYIAG